MLTIIEAKREDLIAITEIYNQAVFKTVATFDTQAKSMKEQRAWFDEHNAKYPILVTKVRFFGQLRKRTGRVDMCGL